MPSPFFRINLLPARHGDCLWVEYGAGDKVNRILIDGGPVSTFEFIRQRVDDIPPGDKVLELVVLSHVDADHVEGLVRLFAEKPLPFKVRQVWFNGWRQMKKAHGLLGAMQGEFLSALLVRRAPRAWDPDGAPWVVRGQGKLPSYKLPGGMQLTLLSPDTKSLNKMAKAWEKAVKKAGIDPGDLEAAWKVLVKRKQFVPKEGLLGTTPSIDELLKVQFMEDDSPPNGSSIAFLAEYGGKSVLFLADAHPDVIYASLQRLCAERGVRQIAVDAVKVAHHGSKNNTSAEMLGLIRSPAYLISTNGDHFDHPDPECVALILKHGKPSRLYFNYSSEFTKPWLSTSSQTQYGYKAIVRKSSEPSLGVEL
jgi:hypothetical protein